MKSLIVFDSVFGNTERVACHLRDILAETGESTAVRVADYSQDMLRGTELLLLASPTRAFKPTPAMTALVRGFPASTLKSLKTGVFDTRIAMEDITIQFIRFFQKRSGGAAAVMARSLTRKGATLISEPQGFHVMESEGPLKEGELDRAASWVRALITKTNGGSI